MTLPESVLLTLSRRKLWYRDEDDNVLDIPCCGGLGSWSPVCASDLSVDDSDVWLSSVKGGSLQVCQWFGFALRLCSWSRMLAPGKSMQADLHAPRLPYILTIYSLPVVLFAMLCSSSFCCIFICTNPKQTLLMSARSSFHWGMSSAVFSYVQTPGILWKHVCAAHSIGESHAMTIPSICCVFICTNPNQTSILGSGGNLQLRRAKKEINWTFL